MIDPEIILNFKNHNKLLNSCDGVFGIKTGFTKKSGRCLVSACTRKGITLITVTLKAPDDWNDHIKLYEYCFKISERVDKNIELPKRLKIYGGDCGWSDITYSEVSVNSINNDKASYVVLLPEFAYAPIREGDCVGKILVLINGKKCREIDIKAANNITTSNGENEINYTFYYKLKSFFNNMMKG